MSNDVLLVSVKAVRPDLVTQTDNVIYVPLASRNAHGIVKIGEGLNITQDGVLSLDSMPLENLKASLLEEILEVDDRLSVHITDYNNPHRVTKTQVGLSNVDNTSDLNKPISTAVQKEITRVEGLIKGSSSAKTYTDYEAFVAAVKQMSKTELVVGQNIYVKTKNVPDLWVYDIVDVVQEFEYTDDATIESLLVDGTLNVGYYKFAALETLKVNLDDYVTLSSRQTITGDKNFTGDLRLNGMDVATIDDVNSATLDTLHFQPTDGSIIYANDKVYYQGEFSYTTINNDDPVTIDGTIVLPIKGDGVTLSSDGSNLIIKAVIPEIDTSNNDVLALTEEEMKAYAQNGGLNNGQLAICIKQSALKGTYIQGQAYLFQITPPNRYSWNVVSAFIKPVNNFENNIKTEILPDKDGVNISNYNYNISVNALGEYRFKGNGYVLKKVASFDEDVIFQTKLDGGSTNTTLESSYYTDSTNTTYVTNTIKQDIEGTKISSKLSGNTTQEVILNNDGFTYNGNQIATTNDIQTAIQNTWEASY